MKSARQLCIAILIVSAITATGIGYYLISDSTGHLFRLSLDDLKGSPFSDYSVPGWILFIGIGIFSAVAAVVSLLHHKTYPFLIIIEGIFMFLFVVAEYIIQPFQLLQVVYGLLAIALILLGNLIRKSRNAIVHHTDISNEQHSLKKNHVHKNKRRGH